MKKMEFLLKDLYNTFGWLTRITAPVIGRYIYCTIKKEEQRLARGWTYEPGSFYEKNAAAIALEKADPAQFKIKAPRIEWVTCENAPAPGR
jgi:hypothetical protein